MSTFRDSVATDGSSLILTPNAYVKSSEQAAYPASNVGLIDQGHVGWRPSSGVASTWVGIDSGSTGGIDRANGYLMVDNINVVLFRIDMSDAADFSTGETSANQAVSRDQASRYKYWTKLSSIAALTTNRRYLRAWIISGSTVDGTATAHVGSIAVMNSATSWLVNASMQLREEDAQGFIDTAKPSGDFSAVLIGNPRARITLQEKDWDIGQRADFFRLRRAKGQVIWWTPDVGESSRGYLCRVRGGAGVTQALPGTIDADAITFEEVG